MAGEHLNVKKQFEDRVKTELGGTYSVSYDGFRTWADEDRPAKWIETFTLGPGTKRPANGSARVEGWTFQATAAARVNPPSVGYHDVWGVVDDLYAAFDRVKVDVVDWSVADPKPTVARLHFGQLTADRLPSDSPEVMRVAVTIPATVTKAS